MKIQQKNIFVVFLLFCTYIHITCENQLKIQGTTPIVINVKQSQSNAENNLKQVPTINTKSQQFGNKIPIIQLKRIPKKKLSYLSSGFHGQVYLWSQRNLIVKLFKNKNNVKIAAKRELKNLIRINQIYPNFLRQIVVSKNQIIGFILQKAIGNTSKSLYLQNQNIFHYDMAAKLHLISLIRQEVRKLQNINYVHGDLFPLNIIVDQSDKKSSEISLKLIDFGNGYSFSYKKLVNKSLGPSGQPPQYRSKNQYYNGTGVNAYQFGLCSLMILFNSRRSFYFKQPKNRQVSYRSLRQKGLAQNEIIYIKALLSRNIGMRNRALFSEPDEFVKQLSQNVNRK